MEDEFGAALGIFMKYKLIALSIALVALAGCTAFMGPGNNSSAASVQNNAAEPEPTPKTKTVSELTFTSGEFDGREIVKTDEEWKKILTPEEYNILREEGTERAYANKEMLDNHKHGVFYCAACGLALFKSEAKFESGTGWPSFFQPIFAKNVVEKVDSTLGVSRTEIECARCHGHLGHVFDDGPKPTGLRYCMNSPALKFKAGA